jgi:transcriptional regulator with XRE-family HTH domain
MPSVTQGQRLKRLRNRARLTQEQLAMLSGVNRSTMAGLEQDINKNGMTLDQAMRIAPHINATWQELLGLPQEPGKDAVTPDASVGVSTTKSNLGGEVPVARAGYSFVPIYGAITAGLPGASYSDVIEWLEMPEWGNQQRWGRVIEGESMSPEFQEGDTAIFEDRQWSSGDGVHAFKDGEDVFKIAWVEGGKTLLRPTNPDFPDIDASDWQIKGVCIRRLRDEKSFRDVREYKFGFKYRNFGKKSE